MSETPSGTVAIVPVELADRRYEIRVGAGLIAGAGHAIADATGARRAIVIADEGVRDPWLGRLQAALDAGGIGHATVTVRAGEASKQFATFERLLMQMLDIGIERRTVVIALGGGVVGDLAGFAAAVALRGLDFVQVPTTLLAQVDSSVGGKTGINTRHGKNLVGAFHQPRLVLIDTDVLDTLPARELRAGYAEVAKYGAIRDPALFDWLEANHGGVLGGADADARRHAIVESCRMKAAIVAADERESGERELLNFGHTFGHALEAELGYDGSLLHGEAVAVGMVMAMRLSAMLGLCPAADGARLAAHLAQAGLPTEIDGIAGANRLTPGVLLGHMRQDKKVRDGRIRFILSHGLGRAFVSDGVEEAQVLRILGERRAA